MSIITLKGKINILRNRSKAKERASKVYLHQ